MSTKAAHRADCRTSRPTKLAKLDVIEDEGKIVLRAEMPGIKPDDVKIEVADDVLTVHGEHEEAKESNKGETKDAGKRFLRRERSYASFTRSGTLPPKVDPSKIEASVHDGVVEITVPLPEEGADKVVQITPKTGSRRFANAAVGGARGAGGPCRAQEPCRGRARTCLRNLSARSACHDAVSRDIHARSWRAARGARARRSAVMRLTWRARARGDCSRRSVSRAREGGSLGPPGKAFAAARPAFSGRRARLPAAATAVLIGLAGCGHSSGSSSPSTAQSTKAGVSAQHTASAPAGGPASSTASTGAVVTGSSGPVTAIMRAGTHKPKAGRAWPVHFTVTHAGSPAKASVAYEFVFGGRVVAHRSHYTFTGHFSDIVVWPSQSVGYPLTFRAVIVSEGATIYLDYPVQVHT